jgi:hypothetical protein
MSNAQPQGGQPVNPNAYPSPSYPSPSLSNNNSSYNYPPPNPQQSEPYRASPTGSTNSASLALPSMRTLDPIQQQQQQQQQQQIMNTGLPPVAPPGYYQHASQGLPHSHHQQQPQPYSITSDPNGQNPRYQLPLQHDPRVMSGGRHKKVSQASAPSNPAGRTQHQSTFFRVC